MATVILELQNAKNSELTLFLVEEPEAHLHPQLQAVLLDYLRDQASQSLKDDTDGPAGRIQVIASTHSPNLASAVGSQNVVVLRTKEERFVVEGRGEAVTRSTVAVPLCDINLTGDERRKIDQYLDVTRAELLFTRRAILVEGIAEAVILPALAEKCVFAGDDAAAKFKRRAFRAVSVISIGSVDFSPYVKLLLQPIGGERLVDRLVVVTDGDPPLTGTGDPDEQDQRTLFNRREALEKIASDLGASEVLFIGVSRFTLEADLMEPININGDVMREAFLLQKPRSAPVWTVMAESESPSQALYEKLQRISGFIGKGEFAHDVVRLIRSGKPFTCPAYLISAIESALSGPNHA